LESGNIVFEELLDENIEQGWRLEHLYNGYWRDQATCPDDSTTAIILSKRYNKSDK